ncbi:MAG: asparagine synthase (glutamine-hydrolyzing) [Candidatus Promineofilum sp.]|nr:asparagine synthase (glutamine-hydrolyzing) [Promineifilum sp.]MBP9657446.1 asparagine synthase (glutamine-hydrolyzing) [Promineifilum sp.]
MCGICGELQFHDGPARDGETITRLSEMMARRGPDDAGLWRDESRAWLAFRRLAILDLSPASHQPMLSADGRFALVFNGEIYNFAELRDQLERLGARFRSRGDTEVVLQALIHWGTTALERFNGMFALAFYDRQKRELLLARDHAGIKPLYYFLDQRGLFFASQYDQIMAHPWCVELPISTDGLALYLRLGYIPAPYATLERTNMLEPGSWLCLSAEGRVSRGTYYTFPMRGTPGLTGQEAWEAVDAAVGDAVRRQMVSDVPLGAFLSGGIDSPLVVAKMQAASSRPVQAYTIGSAGSMHDESEDASDYARQLNVTHVLEQFTPDKVLDWLDDAVAACGEPFADFSIFPTLMVSNLARRDMTVMLAGDGGDELFWGYPERFGSVLKLASDFRRPHWHRSTRWAIHRMTGLDKNAQPNLRWPTIGHWYRQKHTWFSSVALTAIFPTLPAWPDEFTLYDYDGWDLDETAQWLRWNEFTGHLAMVLLKVDRASMYNSLEVRVPLLDREVIEVATRVDWRSCLDLETDTGKIPLRRSLERHISHQTKAKRGFAIPMADWLRGPLQDVFIDRVLSRPEIAGLAIDRAALEKLLADHVSGRADYHRSLWLLLSLVMWRDKHFQPTALQIA